MRIAYADPFSGASGDMFLGALVDAGLSIDLLASDLESLGIGGYHLTSEKVNRHGLNGTSVQVVLEPDQPQRDWAAIKLLLVNSALPDATKERSIAIFERLATAEAKVHGVPLERVHFHEVGAVDAIVDICGCVLGLARLGVEQLFSGPPRIGNGYVFTQHGWLPVPAPATAELLAMAKAPTGGPATEEPNIGELLTPTGAAILTTLAEFRRPPFAPSAIGYGFGSRELPWPNALRLWIGEL